MKNYLKLAVVGLAFHAVAADVVVGTGFGLNANSDNMGKGNVGFVATAEHHNKLTAETGVFVGTSFYASAAAVKKSAPINAGLTIGGSFSSAVSPISAQLGVSFNVVNSEDGSYQVAPGVAFGGIYNLSDNWAMKTSHVVSFPTNMYGESNKAELTSSIGVAKIISMEA